MFPRTFLLLASVFISALVVSAAPAADAAALVPEARDAAPNAAPFNPIEERADSSTDDDAKHK